MEEFLARIEGATQIGNWEQSDHIKIAVLKLTDAARLFYNGCPELHEKDVTWQTFKCVFTQTFTDTHTHTLSSLISCSYKPHDTKRMRILNNLRIDAVH